MKKNDDMIPINLNQLHILFINRFKEIHEFFEKNNIKYFAIGGTALGAYRHKNFIPWDNDMDIAMDRENYDKFLKIALKLNPTNFYIVGYPFTKPVEHGLVKIAIKDTYCPDRNVTRKYDTAYHIDVFPCDYVPNDIKLQNKQEKQLIKLKRVLYYKSRKSTSKWYKRIALIALKGLFFFIPTTFIIKKMHRIIKKYDYMQTDTICNMLGGYTYEQQKIPLEVLGNTIILDFGTAKIRVPEKIELFLKQKYGDDFMTPNDIRIDEKKYVAYVGKSIIGDALNEKYI